jgi:adenylate cyclase class IV
MNQIYEWEARYPKVDPKIVKDLYKIGAQFIGTTQLRNYSFRMPGLDSELHKARVREENGKFTINIKELLGLCEGIHHSQETIEVVCSWQEGIQVLTNLGYLPHRESRRLRWNFQVPQIPEAIVQLQTRIDKSTKPPSMEIESLHSIEPVIQLRRLIYPETTNSYTISL